MIAPAPSDVFKVRLELADAKLAAEVATSNRLQRENDRLVELLNGLVEPLKHDQAIAREMASLLGVPLTLAQSVRMRRRARAVAAGLDVLRTRLRNELVPRDLRRSNPAEEAR